MKKFILVGLCACWFIKINAQTEMLGNVKISGKIIDSISGLPLEYATVTVFSKNGQKPLTGSTTSSAGKFEIRDLPFGNFTLVAECIGYSPFTVGNIPISQDRQSIILKNISLIKKQTTLKAINITVQGRLLENKIDKIVFNAEKDLTSQTGVATDILKKIPQVSVDVNGNVELSGSSGIRFLIDGKPSSAFGSNITDVLQSIPASQIKSVEVITNPGARYDAEGLGGIINIILKKNSARGINGNLSLTGGTRMENGSFNFNARKGTFGVNAFISGNARLSAKTLTIFDRTASDTTTTSRVLLHQEGESNVKRQGYQTGLGFDWTYKEKNNFSGSLSYNNFGNKGAGAFEQTVTSFLGSEILSSTAITNNSKNEFHFHNIDADLNYKRTFEKEDQELEINVTTSFGNNFFTAGNSQLLRPKDSLFYGTNNKNDGKENETELEINYTQPLHKEVSFGTGGKISFADISSKSNVLLFEPQVNSFLYDPSLSNSLTYHQKVYAFYAELSFPLANTITAKIGGRYERTEISSFYSNAQQQAQTPGYNTLVPSVFLLKKIGEKQTIKLNYSKRIERPDYGDLNPFINTSDPQNITAGNPYLLPEIGNRYELAYNKDMGTPGSFMVNLFYRSSNHDIQPYFVYYSSLKVGDSTYNNVSVNTRENIGLEKNAGLNLFGDLHVTPKLNLRTNLFFFNRHIINSLDPGYNASSFNYRFNVNAGYQFTKMIAAEFFGNFNSPRNEVQGRYPSFTSYSMAVRKQFWKKKGSLALTATNLFGKYVNQKTAVFGPGFLVNSNRKIPFRSVGINFAWKFGKLEFKKSKEENSSNLNTPTAD